MQCTFPVFSKWIGPNSHDLISYLLGDVSEESVCTSLIQETVKRFGRLDVLVNNISK
jgi:NAD(P)-dependent dehydrogenase (short-subunit alcohol dehydrogenase family)